MSVHDGVTDVVASTLPKCGVEMRGLQCFSL